GTTAVVAKKLGRRYIGIEIDEYFCCLAEKRLELAVVPDPRKGSSTISPGWLLAKISLAKSFSGF
ncbi:MAG: site-specific DNA-methyltransferase, partial [Leptolyngbya sp. SIO4C5]|nr:site-specific DNA-methyltransferase [Leptolyngbya sp. SIO4C5]